MCNLLFTNKFCHLRRDPEENDESENKEENYIYYIE